MLADLASHRELFTNLTLRELRGKYKRSVLGWTWSLINPLVYMGLYSFVFGLILNVDPEVGDPSGLENFAFFLMCGLLPFTFLANAISGGSGSLIANSNLVKKVYFPRDVLVASNTASWLVSFAIELAVLAVALLFVGNIVLPWLPAILVLVALQAIFTYGVALMLSVLTVYFRDLEHFVALALQVWFYSAPIIVPLSLVKNEIGDIGWLWTLYNLNPLTRFVEAYRDLFYSLRLPTLTESAYLVVVPLLTLVAGYAVFRRFEGRLAEEL
jgi:lipopolysaccharide transport system permease protein